MGGKGGKETLLITDVIKSMRNLKAQLAKVFLLHSSCDLRDTHGPLDFLSAAFGGWGVRGGDGGGAVCV